MKNKINFILFRPVFILVCLIITACAGKMTITHSKPVIVYDEGQISEVVSDSEWKLKDTNTEVSMNDVPLLNSSKSLKKYRPNRAYAIGYPYKCGGSWQTWNYKSETQAVSKALSGCLNFVKSREKHVGEKCGARLILVNKKLLVNPENLPTKFYTPFVMEIDSNDESHSQIYGMFSYEGPGKNLPMTLFNDNGKPICEGRYSLSTMQAVMGSGTFEMQCFDRKIKAQGSLSIDRIKIKDSSATLTISRGRGSTSDGNDFKFITNLTIDQFNNNRHLLK